MLKNLFGSRKAKDKFSLDNLKSLYSQLQREPIVNSNNKARVVEILRTIAELMIWGDQHNPSFFDFFAEKSILANFVKILSQNKLDSKVKIQVIQTLSILIQNTDSEVSIFYLLSNNYINDLIVHRFDFGDEELLAYYISFLKTCSFKLNEKTILFFFNEPANDFPLYTEAIKFFNHPESMVRIAVRTLSLNVYKVKDQAMRKFVLDRSAVPYFSNLVWFLRDQTLNLSHLLSSSNYLNLPKLEEFVESLIDIYYYLQDIMNLNIKELSETLIDQLLSHYVLPVLIGSVVQDKSVLSPLSENHSTTPNNNGSLSPAAAVTSNGTISVDSAVTHSNADLVLNSTGSASISTDTSGITSVPANLLNIPAHISTLITAQKVSTPATGNAANPVASTANSQPTSPTAATKKPAASGTFNTAAAADSVNNNNSPNGPGLLTSSATNETTIHSHLALYLLSQLFQSFTDYSFVNSVAVALFHFHPPQITHQMIANPPQYPVKAEIPLTQILFPKSIAYNQNKEQIHAHNSSAAPNSDGTALNNSTATTEQAAEVSTNSNSVSLSSKSGRDLPNDRNLVARSVLPEIRTLYSPLETCPNYAEPMKNNPYRAALIHSLTNSDERHIFAASGVVLNALQNENLDKELLNEINIYPQRLRKTRKLLDELMDQQNTSREEEFEAASPLKQPQNAANYVASPQSPFNTRSQAPSQPSLLKFRIHIAPDTAHLTASIQINETVHKDESFNIDSLLDSSFTGIEPDLEEEEKNTLLTYEDSAGEANDTIAAVQPSIITAVDFADRRGSSQADPLMNKKATLMASDSRSSNSNLNNSTTNSTNNSTATTPAFKPVATELSSPTLLALSKAKSANTIDNELFGSSDKSAGSSAAISPTSAVNYSYNIEIVRSLLSVLNVEPVYSFRLATFQLCIEFLNELVYYAANANEPCLANQELHSIFFAYQHAVAEVKNRFHSPLGYLILDLIEDEYSALTKPIYAKRLSVSPYNLVAVEETAISGIPLDFRRPNGDFERTKVSVQVFLLLRLLHYKLSKRKDNLFPLGQTHSDSSINWNNLKADDEIPMNSTAESVACTLAVGPKKVNLFLVLDSDNLLLVTRHPNKVGYAIIQMIVSLRHQEPFLNRSNNCVLHVTIRSLARPHPSCRKLKGGSADSLHAPLWNLTLLFIDPVQCQQSKRHLEQARIRIRKSILENIFRSFNEALERGESNGAANSPILEDNSEGNHSRRTSLSVAALGFAGEHNYSNYPAELEQNNSEDAVLLGSNSFSQSNATNSTNGSISQSQ
jgi:hypothetical protein